MKRILMTILCTVMLLSAGCTGKTTQPEATDTVNKKGQIVVTLGLFSSSAIDYGSLNWFIGNPSTELTLYETAYNYIKEASGLFNLNNETYDIEIKDYGILGGEGYLDTLNKLNTDILSGNMPDLLLLNGIPYENYVRKGLFIDLYSYIEKNGLFAGLLSAMETDGKLYYISPQNIDYTWFGLTSVIGSDEITFSKMNTLLKQAKTESTAFLGDDLYDRSITGEELFNILYFGQRNNLINQKEGTCNFMNQDFYDMLDLCKELGSTTIETEMYAYPESLIVYKELYFGGFAIYTRSYFQRLQTILAGRDINITGIPGSGSNMCVMQLPLAVSAQSSKKTQEGACEFIKSMLLREYSNNTNYLPLSKTAFDKMLIRDGFDYFTAWKNETKQPEEYIKTVVNGNIVDIKLPDFTKKDYDMMINLINKDTVLYNAQAPELEIVNSEVTSFLTSDISSQQCAEKIQQRLSIYLAEQK
jgi:hypothetical protein